MKSFFRITILILLFVLFCIPVFSQSSNAFSQIDEAVKNKNTEQINSFLDKKLYYDKNVIGEILPISLMDHSILNLYKSEIGIIHYRFKSW